LTTYGPDWAPIFGYCGITIERPSAPWQAAHCTYFSRPRATRSGAASVVAGSAGSTGAKQTNNPRMMAGTDVILGRVSRAQCAAARAHPLTESGRRPPVHR